MKFNLSTDKKIILITGLATIFILVGGIFFLSSSSPQSSTPEDLESLVGKKATDFTLETYQGKKVTLGNLKGKNVLLFFSEGLMCYPACWDQIVAFAKDNEFAKENTVVLTIINDSKGDWKQAIDKMPELASANVLFDGDKSIASAYGTLFLPSSMHKGQLPGHTYILVDQTGVIRYVYDDPQMAIRDGQMLTEIKKL